VENFKYNSKFAIIFDVDFDDKPVPKLNDPALDYLTDGIIRSVFGVDPDKYKIIDVKFVGNDTLKEILVEDEDVKDNDLTL